jgi:molecular chaperone HtpG
MMIKHSEDDKDIEYEAVNKANAFWTQDKAELKQEDYDEFYKSLTFDFEAPLGVEFNATFALRLPHIKRCF